METFDVVVIGAGPGGYPAAIRAAQLGASVAIIEREELGGTCLNCGCIPSKTLIGAADLYGQFKQAAQWGIKIGNISIDYGTLSNYKDKVIRQLRDGVQQLLKVNRIKSFHGTAAFLGRNRLAIMDHGTAAPAASTPITLEARNTIIATGSASVMPAFLPRHPRVIESRSFLELTALPPRLLVLGGGYIGCELACMAAQLGAKVTLVELLEDVLNGFDPDVRREVRRYMESNLGIRIRTGKSLQDISAGDQVVSATVGDERLEADMILAAVGRRPVTDGLDLPQAGLTPNERGYVDVDEYGRTRVATIYAVGDVTGGIQLAHAATSQGLVVAENACTHHLRKNEKLVPGVIFTTPEIGVVGLSEQEAHTQGISIKTGKFTFRSLGRAIASGHALGFVKWIADGATNQLLGAQVVGAHATELIAEAAAAIRAELTAEELGRTIHAHPTFSEAWMEAAHVLQGDAIHAPPVKKEQRPA